MKDAELRQARLINSTQLSNSQKELETNIATKLWEDLTEKFFPSRQGSENRQILDEQMFRLRLTALNFQDIAINLKPFFERLDARLPDDAKDELRQIAQQVARRQAYRLAFERGWDSGEIKSTKGEVEKLPIPSNQNPTEITVKKIEEDQIRVEISPPYQQVINFRASYFDMPLVDNLKIKAIGKRLALLLIETKPEKNQATLRIVLFEPYMAADRFDLKQEAWLNESPLNMPSTDVSPALSPSNQQGLTDEQGQTD
jgi:hypothetical protein